MAKSISVGKIQFWCRLNQTNKQFWLFFVEIFGISDRNNRRINSKPKLAALSDKWQLTGPCESKKSKCMKPVTSTPSDLWLPSEKEVALGRPKRHPWKKRSFRFEISYKVGFWQVRSFLTFHSFILLVFCEFWVRYCHIHKVLCESWNTCVCFRCMISCFDQRQFLSQMTPFGQTFSCSSQKSTTWKTKYQSSLQSRYFSSKRFCCHMTEVFFAPLPWSIFQLFAGNLRVNLNRLFEESLSNLSSDHQIRWINKNFEKYDIYNFTVYIYQSSQQSRLCSSNIVWSSSIFISKAGFRFWPCQFAYEFWGGRGQNADIDFTFEWVSSIFFNFTNCRAKLKSEY